MLPLYRPLAYNVHTCCLENNFLQTACSCFLAWCDLLDYRAAIPLLPKPNQKRMQMLVEKALDLLERSGCVRPKMHWPLHWPHALQRWQCLPACWSLEREHKVIRRHGGLRCNMAHYENFVMRETLFRQIAALTQPGPTLTASGCYLVKPHKPSKKVQAYLASLNLLPKGFLCLVRQKLQIGQWSCCYSWWCLNLSGVGSWNACSIWAHCLGLSLNVHWWTICWIRMQWNMTLVPVLEIESPVTNSVTHGRMVCLTLAHVKK